MNWFVFINSIDFIEYQTDSHQFFVWTDNHRPKIIGTS